MTSAQVQRSGGRLIYIDWARAIAILLMIEAHTSDAWTSSASKGTRAFRELAMLGGFAAPMFLWLAGVAVALSAARLARGRAGRALAVETICRRGLEVFVLAFLFRLQAFAVSPGSHPVTLFRVDILNIMGPAIVAAGLIWGLSERTWILVTSYAIAAAAVAMATPVIENSGAVDVLPIWVQWYVRPAGDYTTFTGFPWAGFVFAGGASGVLIAAAGRDGETRLHAALALIGVALIGLGFYAATRPSIYSMSSFWTSSPTWFSIRVGILMLALPLLFALARVAQKYGVTAEPIGRFGRSSLFVYWIHMELVYGYATWPLRHRLPLWGTVLAFVVFVALMYLAVAVRDRIAGAWQAKRRPFPAEPSLA